ncbi:hypothetical protein ACET3Z_031019 [Daucus carota]
MFEEITGDNDVPKVLVYSTTTCCWKEIEAPNLGNKFRYMDQIDVVVDGVLYADTEDTIISLDLHDEVFGLVPYPEFVQRKGSAVLDFEGSVAMVFDSVVWTLDDVCGKVSWTKRFSVKEYDSGISIWLSYYLGAGMFYGNLFHFLIKRHSHFYQKKKSVSILRKRLSELTVKRDAVND